MEFLTAGLSVGCYSGVWAYLSAPSFPAATQCYLTRSVSASGGSAPYSAAALAGVGGLSQAGAAASACFAAAAGLYSAAFAATLVRAAHSQKLFHCPPSMQRALSAATHWSTTLLPNCFGLLCLALGTGAGWSVVHKCPCSGSDAAVGPSLPCAVFAAALGLLALASDACALWCPAPERSPLDDHAGSYAGYSLLAEGEA